MIWWYLIVFIVTLVLSVALSPKPQGPRSAAIDDFQFPTAEEGRAIPVVFGTVDITGPNVLWYGDLSSSKIKKSSLFGSSTVGFKYYIGFHLGLCHGEADAVTNVTWGEKQAWSGNITANGSGTINLPDLFGGEKREGGISGSFDVNFGGDAQGPNAYLQSKLGTIPNFRGIVSFIWKTGTQAGPPGPFGGSTSVKSGYVGTTPYVKGIAVRVRRVLKGWHGDVWYSAKALIDGQHMNPAHIIYQAMTDTEWGMGVPTSAIDTDVFEDAADTFYDEGMGLSLIWNQSTSLEDFLQIILNHCAASLVLRNDTGKYQLIPIRGGYDLGDLEEYTPADIVSMDDFQRQGWGETTNEVTLIYTDPDTGKDTGIVQQDLGNIASQNSRIPTKVELRGIRDHELARTVLSRELASRSTPVAKGKFTINTRAWNIPFGRVFKLTWPERQADNMACRVTGVSRGTLKDNTIVIDWVEDIFALGLAGYLSDITQVPDPDPLDPPPVTGEGSGATIISSTQTAPPTNPNDGDAYLVPQDATDVWEGHGGQVAIWNEDEQRYDFIDVPPGTILFDQGTNGYVTTIGGQVGPPPLGTSDIAARDVEYDDTNTSLGADNVQEAIEALMSQSDSGAITVRAFVNGLFRAQTANLALYDSPDGETYTARNSQGQTSLLEILYNLGADKYHAIRNNELGYSNTNDPYGLWTWVTVAGGPWKGLRYLNDRLIAWSETAIVVSTNNGTSWGAPGASTSYGASVTADDPTFWARLGDDATHTKDSGPNNYPVRFTPGVGELGTGVNTNQPGLVGEGKSVACVGLTYIEPRTSGNGVVNIFEGTQDFTVELWVKKYQTAPTLTVQLFTLNRLLLSGTVPVIQLYWNPSTLTIGLKTLSLTVDFSSFVTDRTVEQVITTNLFDGVAHHIAATRGPSGRLRIYVDGEIAIESASGTVSDFGSGVSLRAAGTIFGNSFNKNSVYFPSYMDELATYDEELAEARIAEHWERGSDGISSDFAVREIYYDTPNTQYLVFGVVPDEVSTGVFQYRPRVFTTPDLIEFTLLAQLGQTPVTDNWPIQQVASRLTINQIPDSVRYLLRRPNMKTGAGADADFYLQGRGDIFIDTTDDPDTYIIGTNSGSSSALRRFPLTSFDFDDQLGGANVSPSGGITRVYYFNAVQKAVTQSSEGFQRFSTIADNFGGTEEATFIGEGTGGVNTVVASFYDRDNDELWAIGRTNADAWYLIEIDYAGTFDIIPGQKFAISTDVHDNAFSNVPMGADDDYVYIYGLNPSDSTERGYFRIAKVDGSETFFGIDTDCFPRTGVVHKGYIYLNHHYFDGRPMDIRRWDVSDGSEDTDFDFLVREGDVGQGVFRVSDDGEWIVWNRDIAIDATDEVNPIVYKDSIIAVMMRNLNGGGNAAKLAYSEDGGVTWNYPSVSWPTTTPASGADSIIYDGEKFLVTGKGWSAVAVDDIEDWDFSDGTSGLPETSTFVPYHNGAGRIVAAVRGDYGIRGSLFTDDGLHWFEGPEIKAIAADIAYDATASGLVAGTVQDAIDELTTITDGLASDIGDVAADLLDTQDQLDDLDAAAVRAVARGATWMRSDDAIETPAPDVVIYIPEAMVIKGVSIITLGGSGACRVDIQKGAYSGFPTTASICASAKPEIPASGVKFLDTTLTGWTKTVEAGSVLRFVLESTATFTTIHVTLHLEKVA